MYERHFNFLLLPEARCPSLRRRATRRRNNLWWISDKSDRYKIFGGKYPTRWEELQLLRRRAFVAAQQGLRSWSSTVAASLSLFTAFAFCSLSYLEHARSIQPSTTLIVYRLFSTGFDIARSSTLWLVAPESSLTRLFTASIVFKALVLVLESGEKAKYLPAELRERRPEETSSILNRSVFYWLNQLMVRGSRHLLLPDDLYELDCKMAAD